MLAPRPAAPTSQLTPASRREIVGEFDPKMAPLLLSYGKALYELAFSTQGAIGKEEVGKTAQSGMSLPLPFLLFHCADQRGHSTEGGRG